MKRIPTIYLYQCGYVQETHPSVLTGPVLHTIRQEGNMGIGRVMPADLSPYP